jgi:hypothetical protein
VGDDLAVGSYILVFQVLGAEETLRQTERPVFFVGDAEMTFDDIRYYLPGLSTNAYFVPPDIAVLIEARVTADSRLDPYIVWHADRKSVGEGRLGDDGPGAFIWKVPEETGFYTIRAEVFPFKPPPAYGGVKARGMEKELPLAVSSKSRVAGFFTDMADSLSQWYQFQHDLGDSKAEHRALRRLDSGEPRWMTSAGLYGLAVGTDNRYRLAGSPFAFAPEEQVRGFLAFHLSAGGQGTLFAARFRTFDEAAGVAADPVVMRVSLGENALVLTLAHGDRTEREVIALPAAESERLLAPRLDFTVSRGEIRAELRCEDRVSRPISLFLPVSLNLGEGEFDLGEKGESPVVTAVLDELGVGVERTRLSVLPAYPAPLSAASPEPPPVPEDVS